ncbi:RBBP9/YdeN family alpha/beta hydrolase [Micromonospora echinofusca]|uniref:Alpha/beta hydrolase n=1 Tax=Micromonospora echinofusca TaxID=47858 RepID=A0ABS3W0I2_MICEH|nr:alpha/beta fold hydrolase [Micromonospora echinofusca]MBO4210108.1 alpha/beta hydrolase [Micromonospora echinofusca]
MTRYLLVPGRGAPRPEHWQQRWADAHPDWRWAPPPPGPPLVLDERVAALHAAVGADDEPAVLIAHSGGCLVVATWADRHTGPVRAALLVAPPHLDPRWRPGPDDPPDEPAWVMPRRRLPFRAVVVASRTDPWATFDQARGYAGDWGADLVDAGDAGHLDTASGYGPWPEGERLLASLA